MYCYSKKSRLIFIDVTVTHDQRRRKDRAKGAAVQDPTILGAPRLPKG